MSVKLRLRRGGRKKLPVYRIVAIDSRKRRDGQYIEKVGIYDPTPEPAVIEIDREKALKWLSDGAIPSDTVRSFLKRKGIMHEFSLLNKGLNEEQVTEEMQKWEVLQAEKLKKLEAQAAMTKRDKELKKEAEAKQAEEEAKAAAKAKADAEAAEVEATAAEVAEEAPAEEATEEPAEDKE